MIGAMPAVAIRHERQKQRQQAAVTMATSRDTLVSNGVSIKHVRRASRPSRPTHLPLKQRPYPSISSISSPSSFASTPFSTCSTTPLAGVGSHSTGRTTLTSRQGHEALTAEELATDYCCNGKFPLLHFLVISSLFGITLLIVGLVQLKPNADSAAKKYLFLGASGGCFFLALFFMLIRYIRLKRFRKANSVRTTQLPKDDSSYSITFSGVNHDRESPLDSTALLQQRF